MQYPRVTFQQFDNSRHSLRNLTSSFIFWLFEDMAPKRVCEREREEEAEHAHIQTTLIGCYKYI